MLQESGDGQEEKKISAEENSRKIAKLLTKTKAIEEATSEQLGAENEADAESLEEEFSLESIKDEKKELKKLEKELKANKGKELEDEYIKAKNEKKNFKEQKLRSLVKKDSKKELNARRLETEVIKQNLNKEGKQSFFRKILNAVLDFFFPKRKQKRLLAAGVKSVRKNENFKGDLKLIKENTKNVAEKRENLLQKQQKQQKQLAKKKNNSR